MEFKGFELNGFLTALEDCCRKNAGRLMRRASSAQSPSPRGTEGFYTKF